MRVILSAAGPPHVQLEVVGLEAGVGLHLVLVAEPRNVRVHGLVRGGLDVTEQGDGGPQLLHHLDVGGGVLCGHKKGWKKMI